MGRRKSKKKEIRPTFFVFCEGETEKSYITFLRSKYRLPVEIVVKRSGNSIDGRFIDKYKQDRTLHPKDKTFLVYDYDVSDIVSRLQNISNVDLIFSNPCFELWYLLHCQEQTAELTTKSCTEQLLTHFKYYKKGVFDDKLKSKIIENKDVAADRAKNLAGLKNPSTDVYRLVEEMEKILRTN